MVEIRDDQIKMPQLKWDEFDPQRTERSYDKQRDIFFVYSTPKQPAVSLDVGGHTWIRFDPTTEQVLEIEVEDFEKVFLVKYPELRLGWDKLKPRIIKPPFGDKNQFAGEYLNMFLMFIKDMIRAHPHPIGLSPT